MFPAQAGMNRGHGAKCRRLKGQRPEDEHESFYERVLRRDVRVQGKMRRVTLSRLLGVVSAAGGVDPEAVRRPNIF